MAANTTSDDEDCVFLGAKKGANVAIKREAMWGRKSTTADSDFFVAPLDLLQRFQKEFAPKDEDASLEGRKVQLERLSQEILEATNADSDKVQNFLREAAQTRAGQQDVTQLPTTPEANGDAEEKRWAELKEHHFNFKTYGGKGNPMAGKWQRALQKDPQ